MCGSGYYLVARDGGIFNFGPGAQYYGSTGNIRLNQPIVGGAIDPVTGGYWLVAADGGVFSFNAPFEGSTGGIRLNNPIKDIAVNPATSGYWLVGGDGGSFPSTPRSRGRPGASSSTSRSWDSQPRRAERLRPYARLRPHALDGPPANGGGRSRVGAAEGGPTWCGPACSTRRLTPCP